MDPGLYEHYVMCNCNVNVKNGQSCQEMSNCSTHCTKFSQILTENDEL